jgi:hypothetical protein
MPSARGAAIAIGDLLLRGMCFLRNVLIEALDIHRKKSIDFFSNFIVLYR